MYPLPMIFSLAGIFAVPTFWSPIAPASQPPISQIDSVIVERADDYLKSVLAGDAGAVAANFDEDAVLMPPNQPLLRGRMAIQHFYDAWCNGPMKPREFIFDHLEASVSGDSAHDVGTYKMTIIAAGHSMHDTGKYSAILRHSDGEWKIAYLIFNSDLLPGPK